MDRLHRHLRRLLDEERPFVIGGDFNIIPEDEDCYDPRAWAGDALFQPESRGRYRTLLNMGLTDALRAASPRGVDVPRDDPDTTAPDGIRNLHGGGFDKAYNQQVALAGQQKALSALRAEIASGRNVQLKSAATQALPTLQADYAQAQQLAQRRHLAQ